MFEPVSHVALLRGVNLGGKNRLPMADLLALARGCGAIEPRHYIQSGNLVFGLAPPDVASFSEALGAAIRERFGFGTVVVVRSGVEFAEAFRDPPFGHDPDHLHVGFLHAWPEPARVAAMDPERSPGDRFVIRGREVYLHLPGGAARTKITSDWLDRSLATTCTVRNWRTVGALAGMLGST